MDKNLKAALGISLLLNLMINWDAWGIQTISIIDKSSRPFYVNIFLQSWTNVSLFESVIRLMPSKLWNFLVARMLYDKCLEN